MNIYPKREPIKQSTYWPYKGYSVVHTLPEHVQDVKNLCKEFVGEYQYEYLGKAGLNVTPGLKMENGEITFEDKGYPIYHGKFELDIDGFVKFCNSKEIPVLIFTYHSDDEF